LEGLHTNNFAGRATLSSDAAISEIEAASGANFSGLRFINEHRETTQLWVQWFRQSIAKPDYVVGDTK
jgi:hypothetical protein